MSQGYYRIGDRYVDNTTPGAPVEYICTGAGTNGTSTWAPISGSGGSGFFGLYSNTTSYANGNIVLVPSNATYGSVNVQAGFYICLTAVTASSGSPASGNAVPQFPLPASGTVYWYFICPTMGQVNTCVAGGGAYAEMPVIGTF